MVTILAVSFQGIRTVVLSWRHNSHCADSALFPQCRHRPSEFWSNLMQILVCWFLWALASQVETIGSYTSSVRRREPPGIEKNKIGGRIGFNSIDIRAPFLCLRGGSDCVEIRDALSIGANQSDQDLHNNLIVGPVTDFSRLEGFYASGGDANDIFLTKIKDLRRQYSGFRPIKGDGNCFIRGYIFGVMETCIANRTEASGFQGLLTGYYFQITDQAKGLGYSPVAIEDFYQDVQNQVSYGETALSQVLFPADFFRAALAHRGWDHDVRDAHGQLQLGVCKA